MSVDRPFLGRHPGRRCRHPALAAVALLGPQVPARPARRGPDPPAGDATTGWRRWPSDRVVVVTGQAHREAVLAQLPEVGPDSVIAEPSARDSMAAIGLAAALLERSDPDAVMGSFAADHVITDPDALRRGRTPRRRRRARRLAGHARHRADLPVLGLRLRPRRRPASRATPVPPWSPSSSRSRRWPRPRAISRPAATAGTPACSWSARPCCSTCSAAGTPSSPRPCGRSPPTRTGSPSCGRRCRRSPSTTPWRSPPPTPVGSPSCPPVPLGGHRRLRRPRHAARAGRASPVAALGDAASVLAVDSTGLVVPGSGRVVAVVGPRRRGRRRHPGRAAGDHARTGAGGQAGGRRAEGERSR